MGRVSNSSAGFGARPATSKSQVRQSLPNILEQAELTDHLTRIPEFMKQGPKNTFSQQRPASTMGLSRPRLSK